MQPNCCAMGAEVISTRVVDRSVSEPPRPRGESRAAPTSSPREPLEYLETPVHRGRRRRAKTIADVDAQATGSTAQTRPSPGDAPRTTCSPATEQQAPRAEVERVTLACGARSSPAFRLCRTCDSGGGARSRASHRRRRRRHPEHRRRHAEHRRLRSQPRAEPLGRRGPRPQLPGSTATGTSGAHTSVAGPRTGEGGAAPTWSRGRPAPPRSPAHSTIPRRRVFCDSEGNRL